MSCRHLRHVSDRARRLVWLMGCSVIACLFVGGDRALSPKAPEAVFVHGPAARAESVRSRLLAMAGTTNAAELAVDYGSLSAAERVALRLPLAAKHLGPMTARTSRLSSRLAPQEKTDARRQMAPIYSSMFAGQILILLGVMLRDQ
eukprot:TRINITY_DN23528_c0_g1_i1.p1 TRINITY_DN23528_c0_g1~~TRINITY_DN23528_c0_g1_i1.p1  ORF type:complete len:146 (-),score=26.47 TRINITY_DN23528_c0_g1_i1:274-711(-)